MKNPDNKPLTLKPYSTYWTVTAPLSKDAAAIVLSNLAIAESNLVRAGKDSALPHFIAIVKELEGRLGLRFEFLEEEGDGKCQ